MTVFVINLAEQAARRAAILRRLDALGIVPQFIDAVDGRKLPAPELAAHQASSAELGERPMTPGEIGCALSHLAIYDEIVRRRLPWALVLEDDAAPGGELPAVLDSLAARVDPQERSVVLLSHVDKYTRRNRRPLADGRMMVRPYAYWWRAHGYFVTLAAARSLAGGLRPLSAVADHWIEFERRGLIKVWAVVPYCIELSELAATSSLETARAEEQSRNERPRTLGYHLHRIFYKHFLHQILVRPFLRVARQPRRQLPL